MGANEERRDETATMRGNMLWFNEARQSGFIETEEGERLAVHGADFAPRVKPPSRCAGLLVEFRVAEDGGERRAVDLVIVPDSASRRARSRHSGRG
ncbi:MAG: hypothetical protein QOE36_465 [Gaiellaceae bacterium]|jgi:cold shock CspA family protein|nr:hypothetical protein [Gaiellaceae bacterium]